MIRFFVHYMVFTRQSNHMEAIVPLCFEYYFLFGWFQNFTWGKPHPLGSVSNRFCPLLYSSAPYTFQYIWKNLHVDFGYLPTVQYGWVFFTLMKKMWLLKWHFHHSHKSGTEKDRRLFPGVWCCLVVSHTHTHTPCTHTHIHTEDGRDCHRFHCILTEVSHICLHFPPLNSSLSFKL